MATEKTGIEKARETSEKIKGTVEIEKTGDAMAMVSANEELANLYKDNAAVGSQNLAGTLPQLKIHAAGRSKNTLADGGKPTDGYFFYQPTQEQFKELTVHILTISAGYRADGFEGKKDVFHQLLGGVIVDGDQLKPFVMFFTGLKLENLWNFGKEAGKYTHAKPLPIPMFALTVKLTTSEKEHDKGTSWIVNFEILKDENKNPLLVTSPELFKQLRDNVATIESTFESLIAAKSTGQDDIVVPDSAEVTAAKQVFEGDPPAQTTDEDIPF